VIVVGTDHSRQNFMVLILKGERERETESERNGIALAGTLSAALL
jgi:hypothetical protein